MKAAFSKRLGELERSTAGRAIISGLSHFYDLIGVTSKVGGGRALLDRLDAGAGTEHDRAAVAAAPGGVNAIRAQEDGLDRFYRGRS